MDLLHIFAAYANDANTPQELYEAIEKLGPLPRYVEICEPVPPRIIHVGAGTTTVNPRYVEAIESVRKGKAKIIETPAGQRICREEIEPAVEQAKAVCDHAREIAIRLRECNPNLPPLPPPEADPFADWQTIQEWCIGAQAHVPGVAAFWRRNKDTISVGLIIKVVGGLLLAGILAMCVVAVTAVKHPPAPTSQQSTSGTSRPP